MSFNHTWQRDIPMSDQSSRTSSRRSNSNNSYQSQSTAPTEYSYRPHIPRHETCYPRLEGRRQYEEETRQYDDTRASVETYTSTIPSEDDLVDEGLPFDAPLYNDFSPCGSDAIPATPRDFSELFPSKKRLSIRHDDATIDGNMNLRVDTQIATRSGAKRPMTLFHLRMNDLKGREFSLRRYCRDSGREVCHSSRKCENPATNKRPGLQRSFSSALWNFRRKAQSPATPQPGGLKHLDSGFPSMWNHENEDENDDVSQDAPSASSKKASLLSTNTIKLEFSNYAHVDIKRRGAGSGKRYGFEYWGVQYTWKRTVQREGDLEEASYHLHRADSERSLAHIVPVPLTRAQTLEENARGGWIPSCSLWLTDDTIISGLSDLSDVVVATGLVALVDDCIKRRWHSKHMRQIPIPLSRSSSLMMNMEYVGPKRLIDEVFNRPTRRPTASRHPTWLHHGSAKA